MDEKISLLWTFVEQDDCASFDVLYKKLNDDYYGKKLGLTLDNKFRLQTGFYLISFICFSKAKKILKSYIKENDRGDLISFGSNRVYPLVIAAETGDIDFFKYMIELGYNPKFRDVEEKLRNLNNNKLNEYLSIMDYCNV